MEASDQSISNPASDSHILFGTLQAHLQTDYQSRSEVKSIVSINATYDEVCQVESPQASNTVPKSPSEIQGHRPRLVTVKELAKLYNLNLGAVYAFIKTEPDFPYFNMGVKKKFLVDVSQFETWLKERTTKEKNVHFRIPTTEELLERYKK